MRLLRYGIIAAALLALLVGGLAAQSRRFLFSDDNAAIGKVPEGSHAFTAAPSNGLLRQRIAQINLDRFIGSDRGVIDVARTLELNLFQDVFLVAVLDRVEELSETLIWMSVLKT